MRRGTIRNRWWAWVSVITAPTVTAIGAEPANLDFEDGVVGDVPTGWSAPAAEQSGYAVEISGTAAKTGTRSVLIAKTDRTPPADAAASLPGGTRFGNVRQAVDAARYRGKRVSFSGWVRTNVSALGIAGLSGGQAQPWFRVDRPGGRTGFFDNMQDRPIRSKNWRKFEIVGDVAVDAERINFGLLLVGKGKAWLDDVAIKIVGIGGEGDQPARKLDERGIENLIALTRLTGYVRYFHPTRTVADTDWDLFAVNAVRAIQAETPAELARTLQGIFNEVAPSVRVAPTGHALQAPVGLADSDGKRRVRYWEHYGVKVWDQPSIYSSKLRTSASAPVRPDEPIEVDLGGGVSAHVPTAVPVSRQASFEGAPTKTLAIDGVPDYWRPSGDDRWTRLAAIALAWNVFQHFYPYFDVVDADWEATLRRSLAAAAVDSGEAEFLHTLKRLVADLRDGHGRVGNHHDGPPHLPAVAADWVGTDLVVTAVGQGVDGLQVGDVVTEIDGRSVNDILASLRETVSAATPQHLRDRALSEIGFGAPGSTLTLTTRSPSGQERTTAVERNIPAWEDRTVREPRPENGAELADGVFYVDLDRIEHLREFNKLVPKLAKADGIVFDLRGYPSFDFRPVISHLIDETVTSAQWHVPLVHRPDRRDMRFQFSNWSVRPKSPRFTRNVAFVTDGRAISAAETLLGIVEHYKLAEIVGGPTAGTNGNINPFVLPGGYHVTWTGMRVLKHDGSQHHGVGIQPTVPVSRTVEGIAAGRDELLERAVAVVTGR